MVFLGSVLGPATGRSLTGEPGAAPEWVPRQRLPELDLKPPIGGHLPAVMHPNRLYAVQSLAVSVLAVVVPAGPRDPRNCMCWKGCRWR